MKEWYWTLTNGNLNKTYSMESYWTWTKIRSFYLANKGIRCGGVLEWWLFINKIARYFYIA